jgi:DNA-binding PadR family transcriptional regulator
MTYRRRHRQRTLILAALAGGEGDASSIVTEVATISSGRVRLRAGTLFAELYRLRARDLIAADPRDAPPRRRYRLTPAGRDWLAMAGPSDTHLHGGSNR